MQKRAASIRNMVSGHSTSESRWARFGPYYAMFPMDFAYEVISKYSKQGNYILDPFSGRGSSLFAASSLGRISHGIEINPVGWLYSSVKLSPAPIDHVKNRLDEVIVFAKDNAVNPCDYPDFFRHCFDKDVLSFLISAQKLLDWENDSKDATLMAFILHYMHGKKFQSLSNQMSMVKAMSPQYSLDWWKKNSLLIPPQIDIKAFFQNRIDWRYAKGVKSFPDSKSALGDSTQELKRFQKEMEAKQEKYSLLFTSPPYCGVTNYFVDQWLRLWMLGGPNYPSVSSDKNKKRFNSTFEYKKLLDSVFSLCLPVLQQNAIIYVRTDSREFTYETTKELLMKYFPDHKMLESFNVCSVLSQTELYGNSKKKPCEIDIVLKPKRHIAC